MFRILSFVIVVWTIIGSGNTKFHRPDVAVDLSDSSHIKIKAIYDSLGLIDEYRVSVNTPVCEAEKCYSIQLEFYYDPIGEFLSYDTLEGQELTKLDHIPFVTSDKFHKYVLLARQDSDNTFFNQNRNHLFVVCTY